MANVGSYLTTPLIAWIGLGLFTAGFCNGFIQSLLAEQDRQFRISIWIVTVLLCVVLWPIPFGLLMVIGAVAWIPIPMFRRRFRWTLLPGWKGATN